MPVKPVPEAARAALEVGTADHPIARDHTALIRLALVRGLDPEECPAIVCCGGRMDFHGAELTRAWVKLGATAAKGRDAVVLAEPVTGWRVGDRVIVTATHQQEGARSKATSPASGRSRRPRSGRSARSTARSLTLDAPLAFAHTGAGTYRGEVANLSRNVVVESADPAGNRGHTMYHRYSTGSISYAEFRHLGKTGKLGKYSLHFHRVGDTMRGSSVVGASIWDSGNRWITIHGTNYLVRPRLRRLSLGRARLLPGGWHRGRQHSRRQPGGTGLPGVAACRARSLAFDRNEGAGFWWANSRNAFVRNVAVECDQYGFRYEAPTTAGFDGVLPVRGDDEVRRAVDIRTLPFLRFEDNEAHAQRRYGFNLGGGPGEGAEGGVGDVGPDEHHPFAIRGLRVWDAHWARLRPSPAS